MDDYYRVRFKKLMPGRAPGHAPPMPLPLRVLYVASTLGTAVGWLATVAVGRSSSGIPDPLAVSVLLFPLSLAFWLGFSEHQSWTRPLLVAVLLGLAGLCYAAGGIGVAAFPAGCALAAAAYLYGAPRCRAYYRVLRELAVIRVSRADLTLPSFIPFYTAAAGGVLGGAIGYRIVTRHLGYSSGLGANDAAGLVMATVLGAVLVGVVGYWCGEAIAAKRHRAA